MRKSSLKNVKKRDKKTVKSPFLKPREIFILVSILIIGMGGIFFYNYFPFSKKESTYEKLPVSTEYINDSNLELGEEETRKIGENGTKETIFLIKYTLSGKEISRVIIDERAIKESTAKVVAKGKKRYQYMLCSNGSYRYFTNEEFKNENVGFTHKSPDFCAQNKQGSITSLSDSAPVAQPSRNIKNYPSITNCYEGINSRSFSCYNF